MSRADVRAAVAAFLVAADIPGLATVYAAMPWYSPGELFDTITDGGSGAIAWLHLGDSDEDRWAFPSKSPAMAGGQKAVHYEIAVMVAYQYLLVSSQLNTPVPADSWAADEDRILQAIKDRIHSDPQLGTGPTGTGTDLIFRAAQENNTLRISADDPVLQDGKIWSYHSIQFQLTEVIQA